MYRSKKNLINPHKMDVKRKKKSTINKGDRLYIEDSTVTKNTLYGVLYKNIRGRVSARVYL